MDDIAHIIGTNSPAMRDGMLVTSHAPLRALPPTCSTSVCVVCSLNSFTLLFTNVLMCVSTLNIHMICVYIRMCMVTCIRFMYSVVLTCSHSIHVLAVPSCSAQCHVLHMFDVTLHTSVNVRMCNTYV